MEEGISHFFCSDLLNISGFSANPTPIIHVFVLKKLY